MRAVCISAIFPSSLCLPSCVLFEWHWQAAFGVPGIGVIGVDSGMGSDWHGPPGESLALSQAPRLSYLGAVEGYRRPLEMGAPPPPPSPTPLGSLIRCQDAVAALGSRLGIVWGILLSRCLLKFVFYTQIM